MTEIPNLWPEDLGQTPIEAPLPLAILKEQATFLAKKTKNALKGEVENYTLESKNVYNFCIVAPKLNFYKYSLIEAKHEKFTDFPVEIRYESSNGDQYIETAKTEMEFIKLLGKILSNDRTKKIISTLLYQINQSHPYN
jgi:hypothetical protein